MTLPTYPQYAESGAEWPKTVPTVWRMARLGSECETLVPMRDKPEYLGGPIPWIRIEDFDGKYIGASKSQQGVTAETLEAMNLKLFPAGCVLCSCSCSMGATAIVSRPLVSNQTFIGIVPGARFLSDYLYYYFHAAAPYLDSIGSGAIQSYLSRDDFRRLRVPQPTLVEQAAIAVFLDRETAKIDALIAEQENLIALLAEKRQATISQAVTRGLDPEAPMKDSGIPWLRKVPAHWATTRVKYLVQATDGIQMGPFGGMLLKLDATDTGFKVYGQENTISGDFSRGSRWLSEARFNDLERYQLRAGDLVLTRKGSLGNAQLVQQLPQPGIFDSDTIRVRVDSRLMHPKLLATLLHDADYIALQLMQTKRGAILSGVNTESIANLVVVMPPLHEQNELLEFLGAKLAELESVVREGANGVVLLKERRAALITAAVTGQIDVRGPVPSQSPAFAEEAVA